MWCEDERGKSMSMKQLKGVKLQANDTARYVSMKNQSVVCSDRPH